MHIYKLQHMANIKTVEMFLRWINTELAKYYKRYFSMITVSILFCLIDCLSVRCFVAHLSWKLKWAFLIAFRPSSVCLSVCLSVRLSVNFSYFRLLLKNHWANFNQTWHKASLGDGDSNLFKWRATPFSKGR